MVCAAATEASNETKPLTELPAFRPVAEGMPSEKAIQAFERDGVVCLRNAFPRKWVCAVSEGMDIAQEVNKPGYAYTIAKPDEPGCFYYDTFMYQRIDRFERFYQNSPAADLAMNIMRSKSLIFYFDFMLVKEPGTSAKTPWHYDEAYWPISGDQMCNLWMVVEPTPVETTLRFVRGSHRWQKNYRLMSFDPEVDYPDPPDDPPVPDWDVEPGNHEIVYAALEPGDCVVFHNRTHHSAPGNRLKSTRRRALATHWIGDDIRFNNKTHTIDPPHRAGLTHGGSMECKLFPRVR